MAPMARRRRGRRAATTDDASKGGEIDMKKANENRRPSNGVGGASPGICGRARWRPVLAGAAALLIPAVAVRYFGVPPALRRTGPERGEVQKKSDVAAATTDASTDEPYPPKDLKSIFVGDRYEVLQVIPHDPKAFTQGLTYFNGKLYEGTGLNGQSQLRELGPTDGRLIRSFSMEHKYFGEGIAHYHDAEGNEKIIQITWRENTGFIYDARTFEVVREFKYETTTGEGWGITYDPSSAEFIVSDGSHWIFFWDRDTLEEKRRVEVRVPQQVQGSSGGQVRVNPVRYVNELELTNGLVLANVWYQDVLLAIDPKNGNVMRVYDFTDLYKDRAESVDCFNGISVTDRDGELIVTGKLWPNMYRIKLLG